MTEKYDKNLVEKYLKDLKKEFPNEDLHLLEMAILQYLFIDCNPDYKPDENNESYLKAKELYKKTELNCINLN